MFPSLLHQEPAASPEDEVAFKRYTTELTSQYAVQGTLVIAAITILWWPIDHLVKTDARFIEAFAALRVRVIIVELATLLLFLGSARVRAASLVFAPLSLGAFMACIGYSLGQLGGSDLSWFADSIVGIFPTALIPLRLQARVFATTFVAAALTLGFLVPPALEARPSFPGQISFILFAALFAVFLGELLFRPLRRSFLQQRELHRVNTKLEIMTDTLAAQVAERTRELQALTRHTEQLQETERRRIARELHDDLGQSLTAMRYTLARLTTRVSGDESSSELVSDLDALVDGASTSMRSIVSDLRPRVLDDLGLVAAAEWLCERVRAVGELDCELRVSPDFPDSLDRPPPELALPLFRVLQEATTNTLKYAHASRVELSLRVLDGKYQVSVEDNGEGFDVREKSAGFGLLGLRERVKSAGGELEVTSTPGAGTRIVATLPCEPGAEEDRPPAGQSEQGSSG